MNTPETLVIGGSFNPPTWAHEELATACLMYDPDAEVWLLPSGERMDKDIVSDPQDRLHLLGLMTAEINNPRLQICTVEIENTGLTQTFRTVNQLAELHPRRNFRYVYGIDAYESMPRWEQGERLQNELPLLLVPRDGKAVPDAPNIKTLQDLPIHDGISSTAVREALASGEDIDRFCRGAVARFIEQRNMYATMS